MYTSSDAAGGSLIYTGSFPNDTYEVRTTLTLTSSGGNYITYVRGDQSSMLADGNGSTFYAVEIANPTISGTPATPLSICISRPAPEP
jgi:hypothetical protein